MASSAGLPVRRDAVASTLPANPATLAVMAPATLASMPSARGGPPINSATRGEGRASSAANSARAAASLSGEIRCAAPRMGRILAAGLGVSCRPITRRSKRAAPKPGRMQCTNRAPFCFSQSATGALRRPADITNAGQGGAKALRASGVRPAREGKGKGSRASAPQAKSTRRKG